MLGILRFFNPNSLLKSAGFSSTKMGIRSVFKLDFDSDEEIVENYFDNIMLIGINLPENRNVLTETAISKLNNSLKNFESNDDFSSAIVCGFGGTFCTGVALTENALKESQKLIETLHKGKKPVIAALNGSAINFGFHLAVMCDLRVMEEESMAGFGSLKHRAYVPDIVYQRLGMIIGPSRAAEVVLPQTTRPAKFWFQAGFCCVTSCGNALGHAVRLGTSIGLKPLKEIIEEKSKIFSVLEKN